MLVLRTQNVRILDRFNTGITLNRPNFSTRIAREPLVWLGGLMLRARTR